MKLIIIIMTTCLLQVSANTYSQKVTLSEKNSTIIEILKKIKKQTNFDFLYEDKVLANTIKVSIQLSNVPLKTALDKIFENQNLSYSISDQTVVINLKKSSLLDRLANKLADITITGKVVDEKGKGLPGATIKLKGSTSRVAITTGENGNFSIVVPGSDATLLVSYIGYKTKEVTVTGADVDLVIRMETVTSVLEEVSVVSTGYQSIPKERATGSFEKIDNKLFNRITGTDIVSRINGTVPGIYLNVRAASLPRGTNLNDALSIRGPSSFSANKPLIILDNNPYEGDINNINPNDIESVTVLKDASAASIWGARAGNGVVVFTTKSGKYNQPLEVSLNTNISISEKPDLFYLPTISPSDFIDVERFLFGKGRYDGRLNTTNPYPPFITPVVELLAKQRNLPLNDLQGRAAFDAQIDALRQYDVRNDFTKYVYREGVKQQHALNVNGGGGQIKYYMSAGYDKNLNDIATSDYERITLRSNVDFTPLKKLDVQTNILYTRNKTNEMGGLTPVAYGQGLLSSLYSYARLADDQGGPLAVGTYYRMSYLDQLSTNKSLLDWRYKPLADQQESYYDGRIQDILLNLGIRYQLFPELSGEIKYQYQHSNSILDQLYRPNSYFVRDLTNTYVNPATMQSAVPAGGIFNSRNTEFSTETIRGQLNFKKEWNGKHDVNAVGGVEARKYYTITNIGGYYYGYNENTLTFENVDTKKSDWPLYYGGTSRLPGSPSIDDLTNRFTSMYLNASYFYDKKYGISASIRKDASNVFGDNTNKNGMPTWSAGAIWDLSNEKFYQNDLLPYLRVRVTYGFSGNVNNSVPAYSVVTYNGSGPVTNLPYATTFNPPNPNLRWEKVGILNFGLDFGSKNSRISGSLEYYDKRSSDVISSAPIDPTKGFMNQVFNVANLRGKGVDLSLNSTNISIGDFSWKSNLIFNYNTNKVTRLLMKNSIDSYIFQSNSINPREGYDPYAIFAYPWAGLDPNTGDPQGFLDGNVSKDYWGIIDFNRPLSDLQYLGTSRPKYFGTFRNTFFYKGFELSANVFYKLAFRFVRPGLNYTSLFSANTGHKEFSKRWQNPGDEKNTNVPSMKYPADFSRDLFYNASAALVEKGDFIRLQDITLAYTFNQPIKGIKNLRLYSNINNLGIIWRANKLGLDPDILSGYPLPRMIAFGLNANF